MNPFKAFVTTLFSKSDTTLEKPIAIYDIKINSLQGKPIDLNAFKGKHILFVNVASKCGFTSQYKELQELSDTYKESLVVVGVPCNQFGKQEPGNASDIESFCEINYGVTFLITEKVNVKGNQAHDLYKWLTQKSKNTVKNSSVKWNFQKYLIDTQGHLIDYFFSTTKPLAIRITKHIK